MESNHPPTTYNPNSSRPFNSTPSPFHQTSPSNSALPQSGPGTANPSPHSSIISGQGGGGIHNQHQHQGQGQSPLGPTYLTRFPNHLEGNSNFGSGSGSGSNIQSTSRRPNLISSISNSNYSDIEMYGSNNNNHRSDSFSSQHNNHGGAWPAIPSATGGGGVKEDRGWNNDNDHEYNHHSSKRYNGSNSSSSQSQMIHPSNNQPETIRRTSQIFPSAGPTAKRGSKACVACRKGKNRCEWDPSGSESSCRRCLLNGTKCIFEKPSDKSSGSGRGRNGSMSQSQPPPQQQQQQNNNQQMGDNERVYNLEKTVHNLTQSQDQIQNVLQQILQLLPTQQQNQSSSLQNPYNPNQTAVSTSSIFPSSVSPPSMFNQQQHQLQQQQQYQQQHQQQHVIHNDSQPGYMRNNHDDMDGRIGSPQNTATGRTGSHRGFQVPTPKQKSFPKLPGFAPPAHQFGTYGVIPLPSAPPSPSHSRHSSRSSSRSADSSSALPRETLTAPIQALQALANAADQIAKTSPENNIVEDEDVKSNIILTEDDRGRKRKRVLIDPKSIELRVKKKKKPDPTPRNPFPDVVSKGLVSESEARELWDLFFKGCHYFVPLWDKSYDTYETFIVRTPFSTDALLAVAAKIRAENGPLGQTFQRCLEEAQGIARSTLFGPIVRKEAVMAMLILSVWSQNGWLPCGHALRMGLDMNLHRALDRLANKDEIRSEADERDLVVSARIWLNCYMHEHLVSLGTGKPLLLRDDSSVKGARDLLSHAMASETDMRLVAGVELVNLRIRILEHLNPLHGKVDSSTISFVKRMLGDLKSWHTEWNSIHKTRYNDEDVLVKLLETELCYAQLWTVCVALRGVQWDKLAPDQRELAFQAKDSSFRCLEIFLRHENFRKHLKYATHDQLVSVAFAAVFLLKIAMLYPTAVPLPFLISQVSQLAHLLSAECYAERYALTLRLMLSNFRRKTGAMSTMPGTPRLSGASIQGQTLPSNPTNNEIMGDLDGGLQSLLGLPNDPFDGIDNNNNNNGDTGIFGVTDQVWDNMTGLEGFNWPTEFSPSSLPVWLQDGNVADLGLPADGSDSLFLPPELANLFLPTSGLDQYVLPDTGDVGAEAW
ncbi:uncharacterized protein I206_102244 [Kwoniella pini CBS 10737]|uniref:Zn(2)-C6 fungal-type domain-containing protein n=1 Tax=Kwoniella pini CBS 10737 TaxID=1296096 RepID=A0A1B9HSY5_9TREE|nr:uncharacterized protein I206_07614 [Kwoniella pini CBS 10737]OCF46380.1 hypothetical protein I206_07614 [Kwoniella pini CBS 10737]